MRLDGYAREAWRQVGVGGDARRGDLSHTNRELDQVCALARAAQVALDTEMTNTMEGITAGTGCFIMQHDDATPLFLRFGNLQPQLMESSRYLVQNGRRWHSVSYSDYIQVCGRTAPTTAGIVELLAVHARPPPPSPPEFGLHPAICHFVLETLFGQQSYIFIKQKYKRTCKM